MDPQTRSLIMSPFFGIRKNLFNTTPLSHHLSLFLSSFSFFLSLSLCANADFHLLDLGSREHLAYNVALLATNPAFVLTYMEFASQMLSIPPAWPSLAPWYRFLREWLASSEVKKIISNSFGKYGFSSFRIVRLLFLSCRPAPALAILDRVTADMRGKQDRKRKRDTDKKKKERETDKKKKKKNKKLGKQEKNRHKKSRHA